ncbi:MAG: flagellar biosynthetic protein FliR [Alphaproteobacteria bacterium]|nr:flagellar biosynthetic protein FliR [Alphaproteobacteria bacterium]
MTSYPIDKFFSGHVFAFLLLFSRLGSVLMLFPGIGENYVPPRMRLMLALTISFLLMTPMLPRLPAPPADISELTRIVGYEIMIGLFFGTLLRLIVSTLETVGSVIAFQTGLSNATILNPAQAAQSPLASAFFSVVGLTLIFVTGLDHFLLRGLVSLYDLFPPGGAFMTGDMAQSIIQTVSRSFVVGIELGMPFLVIGLLMYVAIGMMQKLMPQVQLFLVVLPIQIWGGMALIGLTIAGILTMWLRYFDSSVGSLLVR